MKTMFAVLMTSMLLATVGLAADKTLSKEEVRSLVQKANTPAEHNKLAQYYGQKADQLEAEANEHAQMAKLYKARPNAAVMKHPMSPDTPSHCENLAANLHKAAVEARALSAAHAEMAKQ
jgi:glutamate/tyrosine decarboxylase-like PLP-dependent enzyme